MDLDKQLEEAQNAASEEKDTSAEKPKEDDTEQPLEEQPATETETVHEESQDNVLLYYQMPYFPTKTCILKF